MKRRTCRLRIAYDWLAGTSAVIIAVKLNIAPVQVEREVRRIVRSKASMQEVRRL